MARFVRQTRRTAGQAPGALVHVGDDRPGVPGLTLFRFDEAKVEETHPELNCALPAERADGVAWLNVDGVHDASVVEQIGKMAEIHPLLLEDIMHTLQRPKLEDYGSLLFVSLRMLQYHEKRREIEDEQVSLVLGASWLISFQEAPGDVFDPIRERIRKGRGRVRRAGADYLFYSLIDAIVDNYFVVLEHMGDWVEEVYERVTRSPSQSDVDEIRLLQRELLYMRKSIWPLREVLSGLARGESPLLAPETQPYVRDAYDHAIQIIDTVETFREMLNSVMDVYLSSLSNRMNEVMKVLTIIATLFMPLSFVAGVYGMNFRWMPELGWRYGYFAVLGIMAVMALGMLSYFHRRRWL
ncbi:MAG: magnesium/cobalt transporter CorA [Candidatus Bipolaricaulis sp.]|nr:magnesium/cobalt transporter CorA [Candidatus Bipolaricaulis sp.]